MIDLIGFIAFGYFTVSSILFCFPLWRSNRIVNPLLKKVLRKKGILHISHRGGSRDNLENTIEAFQYAQKMGTNCLEMDVCMTKDQKVIVIHDSSLRRMTGVDKHAHEFDYDQLPKFLDKVKVDFSHKLHVESDKHKDINFPLLKDVFNSFPDILMNIEIKTPNYIINNKVNDLIKQYKREELTIWGTRYKADSDNLYKLNNKTLRFFSLDQVLRTYIYYMTGLLPFIHIPEDSIQIPLFTYDMYNWKINDAQQFKSRLIVHIYHLFVRILNFISPPLFWHLNKRGILTYYWVLNEDSEYEQAMKAGVNGIMTDRPHHLKIFLLKNKKYIE